MIYCIIIICTLSYIRVELPAAAVYEILGNYKTTTSIDSIHFTYPHAIRTVSTEDREYLQSALQELFWGIVNKEDKSEVQFYTELVSDIERDSDKIFTVDDIMNYPVNSVKRALKILEIFDEIFDDINCVNVFWLKIFIY